MSERVHAIASVEGKSPAEMAVEIGRMRYDAILVFLSALSEHMRKEAAADEGRGRRKLATELRKASAMLDASGSRVAEAWRISKPFMEEELAANPELFAGVIGERQCSAAQ